MINLFDIAPNDQSINYLRQLFGTMYGVIPSLGGPEQAAGADITLLSTMFRTFNTIVLAVGTIIVMYVTIVGVISTAHEGEFMGKKFNNIWIPIRTVLGIAALVPLGSGYSALQLVLMWIIVQGVGAADTLWGTVLGYIDVVGSPYGQVNVSSVGTSQIMNDLFKGMVCDASARVSQPDPANVTGGGYYCNVTKDSWCTTPNNFNPDATSYALGPLGNCGTLTYCDQSSNGSCKDPTSLACLSCKAQINALATIIPAMNTIAQIFVQADYQYRDFYAQSFNQTDNPNWSWIYDYCAAQNPPIPKNQCCVKSTNSLFSSIGTCQATSSNFPSPYAGGYPYGPEDATVVNLYWPFAVKPQVGSGDFIKTSVNQYTSLVQSAVSTYIAAQGQNTTQLNESLEKAKQPGWIFAGSYYYTISQVNQNNFDAAMPSINMAATDPNQNRMGGYRNNFAAAGTLEALASGSALALSSSPHLAAINGPANATLSSVSQSFAQTIQPGNTNPLIVLQGLGTALLVTAQILYPLVITVVGSLSLAGFFDVFILGTGAWNPVGPTLGLLLFLFVPVLFAVLGMMVTLGATLAIYVPLIPYVIFTFGAIGWLISTIETMVAGPLVALGILNPSGQHEFLGSASHALMLIFNVFLRPSLMIFGLVAAMLLATIVVTMINYAYWTTVAAGIGSAGADTVINSPSTAQAGVYANPLELAIFVMSYVMLIVAALNKCFAAIHIIPERVIRWIGGQGEHYGEGEIGQELKGTISGGAGAFRGAGEAARGKVESAAMGSRKKTLSEKGPSQGTVTPPPESKK